MFGRKSHAKLKNISADNKWGSFWWYVCVLKHSPNPRLRGYVTALIGRALEWHSRGQRFDPAYLHQNERTSERVSVLFFKQSHYVNSEHKNRAAAGDGQGTDVFILLAALFYSVQEAK